MTHTEELARALVSLAAEPEDQQNGIPGMLQVDLARGVVWFNDLNGNCRLRICQLELTKPLTMLDITWGVGYSSQ